jgi:hypothetical protein
MAYRDLHGLYPTPRHAEATLHLSYVLNFEDSGVAKAARCQAFLAHGRGPSCRVLRYEAGSAA